jgi:hypothetical protein
MAFSFGWRGPNIVKDGLVLYLDAGSPNSYYAPAAGTTWRDISGNNNNGTLVNGPTFNSANGGYIRCDGSNDYIQVPDSTSLDFGTSNFTIEYWFKKLQTTVGYSNIWGPNKWNTGASPGTNEWSLGIGNGTSGNGDNYGLAVEVGPTIYSPGDSSEALLLNTWYQLLGVREGASLKTYLNGVLKQNVSPVGFSSLSSINNAGRNLRINNSALDNYFTAADNSIVRIYNRALSATEVLQNYNATKTRFGL